MLPGAIKYGGDGGARLPSRGSASARVAPANQGGLNKRNRRFANPDQPALKSAAFRPATTARAEAEAERRPRTAWHAPYQVLANNAFLDLAQLLEVRPLRSPIGGER